MLYRGNFQIFCIFRCQVIFQLYMIKPSFLTISYVYAFIQWKHIRNIVFFWRWGFQNRHKIDHNLHLGRVNGWTSYIWISFYKVWVEFPMYTYQVTRMQPFASSSLFQREAKLRVSISHVHTEAQDYRIISHRNYNWFKGIFETFTWWDKVS